MSKVDFKQIIHYQQQYNDEYLKSKEAEVISEDLSYFKCHLKNFDPTLPFRGFWYIFRQICDAFSDYSVKT